jgi:hypothetical protein
MGKYRGEDITIGFRHVNSISATGLLDSDVNEATAHLNYRNPIWVTNWISIEIPIANQVVPSF